jgi:hypothetical protein
MQKADAPSLNNLNNKEEKKIERLIHLRSIENAVSILSRSEHRSIIAEKACTRQEV